MHQSKKHLRKTGIDHEQLKDAVFRRNQQEAKVESVATLKDSDLFQVNNAKEKLTEKRAALAKDRFKEKEAKLNGHLKSKTEQTLLKRLMNKQPA
jgi:hypothetical protein